MFKHILIPTDGSELAGKAIEAGLQLAKALGAKVTAYHAIEVPDVQGVGDEAFIATASIKEFVTRLQQRGESYLAPVREAAEVAGVACDTLVTQPATPHQGIIDAANDRGCDAILMASHGRGDFASLLLGSVTHKVLAHSKIPVIVFR
jgi:nucleotide-binding universal stress UspA family protein